MNNLIIQTITIVLSSLIIQFLAMTITGIAKTEKVRMNEFIRKPFIFRVIRYALLFWLIHLLLTKANILPVPSTYFLFENLGRSWNWKPIFWYVPILVGILSISYLINNHKIRKNLSEWRYKKLPFKRAYGQFTLSSMVINVLCMTLFTATFVLFSRTDNWFTNRQLFILDWLVIESNGKEDFTKGFYFSFLLSAVITIIYLNSVMKFSPDRYVTVKSSKFFLLSIVLFFTLLTGIYSITNFFYNMQSRDFAAIYQEDKQLGVFALRLASLILLFHTLAYLSKYVMQSGLFQILYGGISPFYTAKVKSTALSERVHSTTFIAQIGFYILNIAIAEFSLLLQEKSTFRNILSFGLAFIVDDYIIIHNYSNKFKKVMFWHNRRIDIFNGLLLISGASILISLGYYFLTFCYLILSFLLGQYYYKNQDRSFEV